jgi:hypothetical protein
MRCACSHKLELRRVFLTSHPQKQSDAAAANGTPTGGNHPRGDRRAASAMRPAATPFTVGRLRPLPFAEFVPTKVASVNAPVRRRRTLQDDFFKKKSIESLVAATEHIRDCARSRRVYCVAFDILLEAIRKNLPAGAQSA